MSRDAGLGPGQGKFMSVCMCVSALAYLEGARLHNCMQMFMGRNIGWCTGALVACTGEARKHALEHIVH